MAWIWVDVLGVGVARVMGPEIKKESAKLTPRATG